MTPPARIAAAIDILDVILDGTRAEKALKDWARGNRYAGSKDRAAIRDLVFDALRRKRSYAAQGGALTGRGLMIGALRDAGTAPETMFTGEGYAPAPLGDGEGIAREMSEAETLDCPDWLLPHLQESLGAGYGEVLHALRLRAPVFLRVNLRKGSCADAITRLAQDGIAAETHPLAETALLVTDGARRVALSQAYQEGLVELQDAASQAVVAALPLEPGMRFLDFCAGGGGKTLAVAALCEAEIYAHDAAPNRMRDLAVRAERAGISVRQLPSNGLQDAAPFDLILADAPCSGSGSWRRDPEGKWRITSARLDELCRIQASILDEITEYAAPESRLAYATCSLLREENEAQVAGFLARHPNWTCTTQTRFSPTAGGDGFFLAVFARKNLA